MKVELRVCVVDRKEIVLADVGESEEWMKDMDVVRVYVSGI